ncbi:Enhanced intracellular survival protein [Nocardia otitidiscaviarum]|uniref:Enhanced intracellular survival protein n=1 Tax=Nocardia otitidiscaviarum TaxID=1823 RepID=A0A378YIC6_9NOCA|nr:GNAT family N-acetyltransferase [Nocardia otitidiscaviarum]SUA76197.1 Enhanced intracellular survival protein [Nocardia otitidiscaviarum]
MASTHGITIRSSTRDDWPAVVNLLETSFGQRYDPAELDIIPDIFTPDRALLAMDGDRIVGHAVDRRMTVTVPGEGTVLASGISAVSVAPTHRRRGILRALYTEQHARTEAEGLPLTMFTASEGTIYGRFGYGTAIERDFISIDRHRVQFRPTTLDPGGVEIAPVDEATQARIRDVYDRWRRLVPGAQERPDPAWRLCFADPPRYRGGASTLYALLHPDGYVLYRREWGEKESVATVWEFRAVTAEAHAALWRVLLGLDLVDRVVCDLADNDPLPYLLTDPRLVQVTGRRDHLWVRIMDVPAALTARTYRCDLDVIVAVHDPFRDAGGTFALRVRDGIAECEPTTRSADLELGTAELSSLYLGGHRARVLAAANRIQVKDPAHLRAVDEAFATDRDPELGWFF